jgi:class 3 adenylate cyclase
MLWTGGTATGVGVLFAATYPDRCAALILFDPRARGTRTDDYPWAPTAEEWRATLSDVRSGWGKRDFLEGLAHEWAPDAAGDAEFRDWFVWHMRRSLSPGAAVTAFRAAMELDVRDVLAAVRVPTLLLPRPSEPGPAHYLAARVRDAEVVDLPPFQGIYTWIDDESHDATIEATTEFSRRHGGGNPTEQVLVTILFTDIVGSTELMVRLGDAAWRDLLRQHHALVRRELARFNGRELDTAGDGFFAVFDGPARAVRAAAAIVRAVKTIGLNVRAGLHTGECEVSDGKVTGIAVSTGARICGLAAPGKVLVSGMVKDLVGGSELKFSDHGDHELKGVPGRRNLFELAE